VNGKVLVLPFVASATPMLWAPSVAVLETLRVAVIVVEFTTAKVPAASVTPPARPVSPVVPVRFAPVMVTGTASVRVPRYWQRQRPPQ